MTASLRAAIGDVCKVYLSRDEFVLAEVIGFHKGDAQIMPLEHFRGLQPNARVVGLGRPLRAPVGEALLGRVIDGLCQPIDSRGAIEGCGNQLLLREAPSPLDRPKIATPFVTGQRVLDGLLTLGQGQRIGLFAGGGVGKSTLLGEIAKYAESDMNVIALIGERGREVVPFLEDCLGETGRQRSVVIVATAEQPALTRIRAAQTAITIADHFRRAGKNVLFMLDSITRLAMAQREVGLMLGEPPSARGFTPSVFQLLAMTMELLGRTSEGSITAIITVLVDGDETDEPISDAVRAILDGHIILNRRLAEKGHFPAVDVGQSISRVFREVTTVEHQQHAQKIRQILASYADVADLVRAGIYAGGTSQETDRVLQLLPVVNSFLKQELNQHSSFDQTRAFLIKVASAWPY